ARGDSATTQTAGYTIHLQGRMDGAGESWPPAARQLVLAIERSMEPAMNPTVATRSSPLSRRRPCVRLALLLLVVGQCALGATIVVTRNDDPAPNGCLPGDCSLRE